MKKKRGRRNKLEKILMRFSLPFLCKYNTYTFSRFQEEMKKKKSTKKHTTIITISYTTCWHKQSNEKKNIPPLNNISENCYLLPLNCLNEEMTELLRRTQHEMSLELRYELSFIFIFFCFAIFFLLLLFSLNFLCTLIFQQFSTSSLSTLFLYYCYSCCVRADDNL